MDKPFFYQLVGPLVEEMGDTYPKLKRFQLEIASTLKHEEEQFLETLAHGLKLLSEGMRVAQNNRLSGELVFRLYDTYGFPPDLTADVLREHSMTYDQETFEQCMTEQRQRSQQGSHFVSGFGERFAVEGETLFTGYETQQDQGKILQLFRDQHLVSLLRLGEKGVIVLDRTPFYAESGG